MLGVFYCVVVFEMRNVDKAIFCHSLADRKHEVLFECKRAHRVAVVISVL